MEQAQQQLITQFQDQGPGSGIVLWGLGFRGPVFRLTRFGHHYFPLFSRRISTRGARLHAFLLPGQSSRRVSRANVQIPIGNAPSFSGGGLKSQDPPHRKCGSSGSPPLNSRGTRDVGGE
eukprot:1135004-Rhodomonas_salina.1